jgi:hypothetical protein
MKTASARHLALVTVALTVVALAGPTFGVALPPGAIAVLAVGAVAIERAPGFAVAIAVATGAALFLVLHPGYALYHGLVVTALYACRRRTGRLALALGTLALAVPKILFALFRGHPPVWAWLSEPSLAATVFIAVYWWREARNGRVALLANAAGGPAMSWALLFFFPSHAAYPISFGPGDLWRPRRLEAAGVLAAVARVGLKALALVALRSGLPEHRFAALPGAAVLALGRGALWWVIGLNYLELVLTLSGVTDLVVALGRLYGWPLPPAFRWALLAWNPVELWRRWGIYTRRVLLKTVYFPLGGSDRHRLRNVMLTFLASALLLHSGWVGSKYLTVGAAGWRDHAIYFGLQGAAVCACLSFWRLARKPSSADRQLRWAWSRIPTTVATQGLSALLHVIILVQSLPLGDRFRLIARCLGL